MNINIISSIVNALGNLEGYLGWDEESGIVNPDNYSLNAKNKPDSHKGWSEMNDRMNRHRAVVSTLMRGR